MNLFLAMKISLRISAKRDLGNHVLVVGRSGSGKSTLLLNLIYSLILQSNGNKKFGICVLDPHGDLCRSILSFAMMDKNRDRLLYISSAITSEAKTDKEYTACFNPFSYDGSAEMRYLLTETLTECLCELLADATLTTQMISVIRPCIATVLRLPPAQRTLSTLARFFREGENVDLVALGKTSEIEQHRIFFHRWNEEHLRISKNSISVKLSFFLSDQRLANMLNSESTFSLEEAINNGSVLLCNLPQGSGGFASKVMGKLILAYLRALMMRRHTLEQSERRPLYLFLDEFSFVTPSLGSLMAEARKWGLSVCIAGQSLGQIPDTTLRKTIMVNTGLKVVGLTDYQDRSAFAKEISVPVEEMERLRPLQFYLKRNDGRHTAFKFNTNHLSKLYYITKKEKKELLHWLVYKSGQYIPVQPPAPPLDIQPLESKANNSKKKSTNNDNPNNGLKPAF